MYKRQHHQSISEVLKRLDGPLLKKYGCYFGGGTAIVLMNGEYRESVDIDFLVSDVSSYRALRDLLRGSQSIAAITQGGRELVLAREISTDQYGIRAMIRVGDTNIKFEIISEGRIEFEVPGDIDYIENVATLTKVDLVASKLLANSDRWNDDGVFSRDVIDLAMMNIGKKEFHHAFEKAKLAYGDSVFTSLNNAVDRLLTKEGLIERCAAIMKIKMPKAVLWQNLERLIRVARDSAKSSAK